MKGVKASGSRRRVDGEIRRAKHDAVTATDQISPSPPEKSTAKAVLFSMMFAFGKCIIKTYSFHLELFINM
jgi:hypothetical protein